MLLLLRPGPLFGVTGPCNQVVILLKGPIVLGLPQRDMGKNAGEIFAHILGKGMFTVCSKYD